MTQQTNAQRLASLFSSGQYGNGTAIQAAAELRRIDAENDSLRAEHIEDQGVIKVWRRRCAQAEAINAKLLEALKNALWRMEQYNYQAMERTIANARAAIAAASDETSR